MRIAWTPSKRQRWGAAILLTCLSVLGVFLRADHAKDLADPDRARQQGRPIPVRTALVSESQIEHLIGATAVTVPSETASIRIGASRGLNISGPESDIVVKAVHVHDGERVSRGQVLFELDAEIFSQVVRQREAALATTRAEFERVEQANSLNQRARELDVASAEANAKFRLEDSEIRAAEYDTLQKLFASKIVKEQDFYQAKSRLAQAKYQVAQAERTVQRTRDQLTVGLLADKRDLARAANSLEMTRIDLEAARRDVARCQIRSPLTGFISKIDVVPETIVGLSSVITQVLRLDPIHVRMDFPQERIDEVAIGQKAEVVLDSFPKEAFTGAVVRILAQVKPDLRVLPVMIELDNPNNRIRAGISGFVRLRATRTTVTVPAMAVIERGSEAMVFRVENGRARIHSVAAGRLVDDGLLEVRGGLVAGQEVIVFHSNFYRHGGSLASRECYLQDNDLVDVDWRKWARRE